MSHVDDGELTAYADGAWPANDPEALRIGAHLSTCENCRARLELAHALRDRTAEILGYATPAAVAAPSFEELQAQLATSPRKVHRTFPLAWAASIIMALGLGWFGRDFLQNPPELRELATRDAGSNVSSVEREAAEPVASARAPSTDQVVPTPAPAPARAPELGLGGVAGGARTERSEERAQPEQDMAADRAGFAAPATGNARVAAAPPPSAPALKVAAETVGQHITAAEAERRGLDVPRIPELPIARIILNGDTTAVVQSLPDGKLITLIVTADEVRKRAQRDAAAEAAAAAAPQMAKTAADQPIVVRVRGQAIRVTGELSADSLRAVAEKIR